ncbi:MAG: CRISPR-associated protein Cas4 [Vulcanisaeta sp.]
MRERNEVARVVSRRDDPGPAPRCPDSCPFKEVCRGVGNVEVSRV